MSEWDSVKGMSVAATFNQIVVSLDVVNGHVEATLADGSRIPVLMPLKSSDKPANKMEK